ncbi:transcriptional regulator [Catellatospora sp. TT07R-123]|uniref:PadR family transcriptional regulator n=1 Tax=Catellatospora sp. TT07R-123 TaxID=2733863 RepID=UPI001B075317|nr:helix-turn-helix transcriptional regulator [Catellatospora sp. TT07R-123]GHJ47214.1 transcriptional regulator [Catellatospora sp. TT07R-123]
MNTELRLTVPVARVLAALLAEPAGDHYGMELMQSSGLPSGTLYPILARLAEAGWLDKRWEDIDPAAAGRPARAYYRVTAAALPIARQRLAELHEQTRTGAAHPAAKEVTA